MSKLPLEQFLPYRLNRIASEISRRARAIYRQEFDLTIPEWRALASLGQFGKMTAKEIGDHSDMHKTKVSRAIAALEERRWINREKSGTDQREQILSLSRAGESAYRAIIPRMLQFERDILRSIGASKEQSLSLGLDALESALNARKHN